MGIATEGRVRGAQPSERQLALIQPVVKHDTDSGAGVGMARGVQWWEPGTPLYCKVVSTGKAAVVVRSGHSIAEVLVLNARDDGSVTRNVRTPPPS